MTRDELKRLIAGPIATVPTAFDDSLKLDSGRMADLTQWWIAQGLVAGRAPIKVAAAMGEGPDLSDDEWPHLLRTVVNASGGKAAVICGLKPKNTLHTIEDAKKAQDLGAVGLQIDLPFFHHPTQDDLVRFFGDISAAIDIGIMIYNTHWFGSESMTAESMLRLTDAEHLVAIKWTVPQGQDYDDMRQFAHIFNVIDNTTQAVRSHKNGARGYISPVVAVYPQHDLKIWDLLENHQYEEAQVLLDQVNKPLRAFMGKAAQRSGGYRVLKGMMAVMGQPVGAPRPPTLPLDQQEMAEVREMMINFGWPVPA